MSSDSSFNSMDIQDQGQKHVALKMSHSGVQQDACLRVQPTETEDNGRPYAFPISLTVLAGAILAMFCVFVRYDPEAQRDQHVQQYYMWYIHVAVMVFVGFGFLMTFLRQYSYSAVGLNFLASCFVIVEAIVLVGCAQQQLWGGAEGRMIKLNLPLLIDATFCAASAMISFGAVLGKTSHVQLLYLMALHVPMYAVNQQLVLTTLGVMDVGGSITIHVFGAYYGLAAAFALRQSGVGSSHVLNRPSYLTDVTSMVGTLFLWIYWPSFNGALASDPTNPHSPQQFNCVINTILSLCGACLSTFIVSAAVTGKLQMMHIQNATLAGGVAMGSAANIGVSPGFALGVGLLAGVLSTLGFTHIMPWLEARTGLSDTCGVHNLHGMPGLLAAAVTAVACAWSYDGYSHLMTWGRQQPGYEIAGALVTLAVAVAWGTLAGHIVNRLGGPKVHAQEAYDDGLLWDVTSTLPLYGAEATVWDTKVQWVRMDTLDKATSSGRLSRQGSKIGGLSPWQGEAAARDGSSHGRPAPGAGTSAPAVVPGAAWSDLRA